MSRHLNHGLRPGLKHARIDARIRDVDFDIEVKAAEGGDGYKLTGYGSVFGEVDSYREIVAKGAFKESIRDLKAKKRKLPMLWQHRTAEPLGVWDEVREDDRGLYLAGDLLKGVQVAEEARIRAQAGAVTGLSIGYYVLEDSMDEKSGIRTLKKLELLEVSLVTFPANDSARVDGIKFSLNHGGRPSIREFEALLRQEFGFSKEAAITIAKRGYAAWAGRESGSDAEADAKAALRELAHTARQPFTL